MWFEANENLENAVKRNKEEHKHIFKKKVWSVPIIDPRFADGGKWKGEKAAAGLHQGLWLKEFYRLAEVSLCDSLHICAQNVHCASRRSTYA